jgi:PhoPQ-activated pathogenicity-related protein
MLQAVPVRQSRSRSQFLRASLVALCLTSGATPSRVQAGALENYVYERDTNFVWNKLGQVSSGTFTVTHLEMTSQKWRGHPWTHHLRVVRPERLRNPGVAFLFITGSGDGQSSVEMLKILAERAGSLAAVVTSVPNQPLYDGRHEDALIAYTFKQFLQTGDESWPLLFPMTKSAVRAMDALEAFGQQDTGSRPTNFVVAGASKRGWTTWLTAAVDSRTKAIAPMVIDMLNMKKQMEWTEKCYGKPSEQISDYTDLNLHLNLDEPRMVQLRAWVDPFSYRERYKLPKLLLLGTNDRYWTVDSLRHYWNELPGPKLIFQTPNAGHDLGDRKDAIQTLAAFFEMVADGRELPKMKWEFRQKEFAEVDLSINPPAKSIRLFSCDSRDRDFRDDLWVNRTLQSKPSRQAVGRVQMPPIGYRAYLVECLMSSPLGFEYKLSSEARVIPDNFR